MAGLLCFIALNAFLIMSNPEKPKAAHSSTAYHPMQYDLLMGGYDKTTNAVIKEHKAAQIANADPTTSTNAIESEEAAEATEPKDNDTDEIASPFTYVFDLENVIPKLDPLKEKQVQEALIESKKVIQEKQWQDIEKSIADALTSMEKEKVKEQYEIALQQIDWEKLGDKLRVAYDHIDWKQMNEQLNTALTEIKIDSLKQVYTIAIDNLSGLQKELVKNKQCGVPDTDITIQSIEAKKTEMQKAINKLRKAKPRKIVEL
jgi:hypothetical protein